MVGRCGNGHLRARLGEVSGIDTATREITLFWLYLGDRRYHYVVALLRSWAGGENGAD